MSKFKEIVRISDSFKSLVKVKQGNMVLKKSLKFFALAAFLFKMARPRQKLLIVSERLLK
jgi:hypothetical protein